MEYCGLHLLILIAHRLVRHGHGRTRRCTGTCRNELDGRDVGLIVGMTMGPAAGGPRVEHFDDVDFPPRKIRLDPGPRRRVCLGITESHHDHKAIANEIPFSIIKDMVKVFPEALLMKDAENRIPLHLAIENKANFELIKHLVKKCPETVETENTKGEIAFKMANRLGLDEEEVEFLNPFEEVPAQ